MQKIWNKPKLMTLGSPDVSGSGKSFETTDTKESSQHAVGTNSSIFHYGTFGGGAYSSNGLHMYGPMTVGSAYGGPS